jgi:hypothetical protein
MQLHRLPDIGQYLIQQPRIGAAVARLGGGHQLAPISWQSVCHKAHPPAFYTPPIKLRIGAG